MGYSHFWNTEKVSEFDDRFVTLVGLLIHTAKEEMGIDVTYENDDPRPPVITSGLIRFNGFGNEGHETFYLETGKRFSFCKTNHKPYDALVVAILFMGKRMIPGFTWDSDGRAEDNDFDQAIKLMGLAAEQIDKLCNDPHPELGATYHDDVAPSAVNDGNEFDIT